MKATMARPAGLFSAFRSPFLSVKNGENFVASDTMALGVLILACGTSYYAGLTAKYWIESVAKAPACTTR
jgi:fructoselysine-6-P-deglycase FrlB-like protein